MGIECKNAPHQKYLLQRGRHKVQKMRHLEYSKHVKKNKVFIHVRGSVQHYYCIITKFKLSWRGCGVPAAVPPSGALPLLRLRRRCHHPPLRSAFISLLRRVCYHRAGDRGSGILVLDFGQGVHEGAGPFLLFAKGVKEESGQENKKTVVKIEYA